ncbi:glycoside hydrolase family 65 protein [Leptolyngbya sp. FACHB-17]|uniref:glycoside hydrolase family 65 protein n=1 Tax=unclassified Leptolyngbya TaxID=2650499 RepID=UPI0016816110|nr:glycoside hydrolase family 65 protein [Leptolyngbya sp. FACHB-17]MBD2081424.1 glycoside hydrolase family 65 protein [Leptolyngbya sp. FACHB-17]
MLHRKLIHPPKHIYPHDPWRWVETEFYPQRLAQMETLFSTANGYVGMRGGCEEGNPVAQNGTFINGFYESYEIEYAEAAYGYAKTGQTIVSVTDSKPIKLYVDDELFYLPTATKLQFERALNMQTGTLDREILWETPSGKQVLIRSQRLISLVQRHVAAISYEVTLLNAEAPIVISSEVRYEPEGGSTSNDPRLAKKFKERVLLPQQQSKRDLRLILSHQTRNSHMTVACGVDHQFETDCAYEYTSDCSEDDGKVVFSIDGKPNATIRLIKFITYHHSGRCSSQELHDRAERTLDRTTKQGFDALLKSQCDYLDDFWYRSDIEIDGAPDHPDETPERLQQVLRFNLFHILQASARSEGAGIPSKGLTSQAYDGHYFWDAEIYVMPFLTYTAPSIAKNLLMFRYQMLDQARQRAKEVSQAGALFPWRTINGEEASAYYAAGTAQYHIDADIMYALKKYVKVTQDDEFLCQVGAEMLVETARMWFSLGFFSPRSNNQFCIHAVTGPDEYNTVVDNNTYTNLMARENLWYAAKVVRQLHNEYPDRFAALAAKIQVELSEADDWQRAADSMYLAFDEKLGIHLQHDGFLEQEVWDFENTPAEKYPLLLHFHPLVIYRHQVIKQADIVLAMFLLGHEFSREQKRQNFEYYDPLTTGDSSLSVCIQSIVAAEIGKMDQAIDYARYATLMDLGDVAGNVENGCHIASMGGTWMVLVYGFAGLRDSDGGFSFHPRLPKTLKRMKFALILQGQRLEVEITHDKATYLLREGTKLTIEHQGETIVLGAEEPVSMAIKPIDKIETCIQDQSR